MISDIRKKALSALLLFFLVSSAFAQTEDDKNWLSLAYNNNQYGSIIRLPFDNIARVDAASFSFGLEHYHNKSFNFSYLASIGQVTHDSGTGSVNLFGLQVMPKFKLNNGKILKETSRIAPFVALGVGVLNFSGSDVNGLEDGFTINAAPTVGIDLRLAERFKVFVSTSYKVNGKNNYREYSAGIGFSLRDTRDSDDDGILDKEDGCPNEFGPADNQGCPYPDRDGDGVIDAEDQCPDLAGKLANGCPDTDRDGVADKDDACPDEAGKDGQGCPVPVDSDGDGVPDKDDKCPNEAGQFEGCADDPNAPKVIDTDEDGIPDAEDDCPADKGDAANKGCPVYTPELPVTTVTFRFNSSELLPVYKKALDELALLMKEYDFDLVLDGYSDNTGDEAYNLYLSRLRASAVLEYLVEKGVSRNRMTSQGFGIENPVAPNDTRVGRAKNRRVELEIPGN
jgi:outer membrane protein OmpA-like peptidoglycan-associated protein